MSKIKVKKNVYGNYNCLIGRYKRASYGDEWSATQWLSTTLAANSNYTISDDSDVSLSDVVEFREPMKVSRVSLAKPDTVKVYRIEDSQGIGMYRSQLAPVCLRSLTDDRHPTPYLDSGLSAWWTELAQQGDGLLNMLFGNGYNTEQRKYSFGFDSVAQMRNWLFDDDSLYALSKDFHVSVYDVESEHVHIGHTQAAFNKEFATCVNTPIEAFFGLDFSGKTSSVITSTHADDDSVSVFKDGVLLKRFVDSDSESFECVKLMYNELSSPFCTLASDSFIERDTIREFEDC